MIHGLDTSFLVAVEVTEHAQHFRQLQADQQNRLSLRGQSIDELVNLVPPEKAGGWRVEADFVESIRDGKPMFTDFATGLKYMQFTEAVAVSAERGAAVQCPQSK